MVSWKAMFTPAPVMTLQVASKWISQKAPNKSITLNLKGFDLDHHKTFAFPNSNK
jgi:hypothetical protein